MVFLPPLLAYIEKYAPKVRISVPQIETKDHADALVTGTIDLAAGYFPLLKISFHQQPLFRATFSCIVRADHPDIGSRLSLRRFVSTPHVIVLRQGAVVLDKALGQKGISLNAAVKVQHFTAVPSIISRTDMIAIMPSSLAASYARTGRFRALSLPFPAPGIEIRQYWRRRNHHDPGVVWLRGVFERLFQKRNFAS